MMDQLDSQQFYTPLKSEYRRWILIAFIVSILAHAVLLYISDIIPDRATARTESPNRPLFINLTTTDSAENQVLNDITESDIQTSHQPDERLSQRQQPKLATEPVLEDSMPYEESLSAENTERSEELDYSRLTSVTARIAAEDAKNWQAGKVAKCNHLVGNRKRQCEESANFEFSDHSMLANIFKDSFGSSGATGVRRRTERLLLTQNILSDTLDSKELTDGISSQLLNELYQTREQQRIMDCGGQLDQGNCAGEMDVLKMISSIGKLVKKVKSE